VEDGWAWWGSEEDGPGPATLAAVADLARSATVVAGFSQGAAMALTLGAGTAVVAVAGFLPGGGLRLPPAASLVVVHGERDETVDPLHGRMVARRARAGGHAVREVWHPGGHQWPDAATAEVARLLTA
jgi:predicted esterase